MQDILRALLTQYSELVDRLLEASLDDFTEDTLRDPYWPTHLPTIWRALQVEFATTRDE